MEKNAGIKGEPVRAVLEERMMQVFARYTYREESDPLADRQHERGLRILKFACWIPGKVPAINVLNAEVYDTETDCEGLTDGLDRRPKQMPPVK